MNKSQLDELMNQVQSLHTEAHNFARIAAQARRAARLDSGYSNEEDTRTSTERSRDYRIVVDRANRYTQRAELYRQRLNAAKRELQSAIRQYRQNLRDQRQSRVVWDH